MQKITIDVKRETFDVAAVEGSANSIEISFVNSPSEWGDDELSVYALFSKGDKGEIYSVDKASMSVKVPNFAVAENSGFKVTLFAMNSDATTPYRYVMSPVWVQVKEGYECEAISGPSKDNMDAFCTFIQAFQGYAEAEALRDSAERVRVLSETERAEAESARLIAENVREQAETSRAEAEAERTAAETERSEAEAGRSAAEIVRESSETERGNAEALRLEAEAERKACELEREANEAQRNEDFSALSQEVNRACESASAGATRIEAGVAAAESALQAAQKASEDAAASLAATDEISDKAIDATQRAETAAENAESKALKADESAGSAMSASEKASAAAKAANDGAERAERAAETATSATLTATSVASRAEEAAGDAEEAAEHAESASALALESIKTANTAAENAAYEAERAKVGADSAEEKAALASEAAISANEAAVRANTGAERVEAAVTNAETATGDANNAAERADNSAVNADEKAQLAYEAAGRATTAAEAAESAAVKANDAADRADDALGLLPVVPIELIASGENIPITDSAEARLRGLKLYGKSEQFTTQGINLFREDLIPASATDDGITCDYEGNGIFHIYGEYTNTGSSTVGFSLIATTMDIPIEPEAYYTLYAKKISSTHNAYLVPYFGAKSDSVAHKNWLSVNVTKESTNGQIFHNSQKGNYTVPDANSTSRFWIYTICAAGNTLVVDARIQVWLVKGQNTDAPYEPYTGGMPSPNPNYPQEIVNVGSGGSIQTKIYGGNLLPFPYFQNSQTIDGVTFTVNDDRSISIKGTPSSTIEFRLATNIKLMPGTYLYYDTTGSSLTNIFLAANLYRDGNYVKGLITEPGTLTFTEEDAVGNYQIRINIYIPSANITVDTTVLPIIAAGVKKIPYELYKEPQTAIFNTPNGLPGVLVSSGGNYTDKNGQMYLCDEVDFESLEYIKNVDMVVITDTTYFFEYNSTEEVLQVVTPVADKFKPRTECICNYFSYGRYGTLIKNTVSISDGASRLCLRFDRAQIATVDEAKAWFTSKYNEENPVVVLGQLETPIRTPLTEDEIAAYKELCTHYPVTNITNDSGAGMEVKYVADTKKYIDSKIAEVQDLILNNISN